MWSRLRIWSPYKMEINQSFLGVASFLHPHRSPSFGSSLEPLWLFAYLGIQHGSPPYEGALCCSPPCLEVHLPCWGLHLTSGGALLACGPYGPFWLAVLLGPEAFALEQELRSRDGHSPLFTLEQLSVFCSPFSGHPSQGVKLPVPDS